MKGRDGFTLIESLLVLLTLSVFFMVPLLGLKHWQEQMEITRFFNTFERSLQKTHQSAIIEAQTTFVTPKQATQVIEFKYYHHGERHIEVLEAPENLHIHHSLRTTFFPTTGNIQKITEVVVRNRLDGNQTMYQFQLGSGKVVKTTEK